MEIKNKLEKIDRRIVIFVFLLIFALIIYLLNTNAVFYNQSPETKIIDKNGLFKNYKDIYYTRYAFKQDKSAADIYIGENPGDDYYKEGFLRIINKINLLELDFSENSFESLYQSIYTKNIKILFKEDKMKLEEVHKEKLKSISEKDILEEVKSKIKYQYDFVKYEKLLSDEDQKYNTYKGIIGGTFYQKCNELRVLNLSSSYGVILDKYNNLKDAELSSNIKGDCQNENSFPVQILSPNSLMENLISRDSRLYDLSEIPVNGYSEDPDIDDLDLSENTVIKVKNFAIDYLYLESSDGLIPLLRVEGEVGTISGPRNLSFWIWAIDTKE